MPEFITVCKALYPNYALPSICKLKNILRKKREIGDERLREELKLSNYVTITIDGWSTRSLVSMMGVVIHYQPRIAKFTLDICNYWQKTNKVVRIGTDNGANMIKAFADFSDELQLDDIDLIVQDIDSEGNKDFNEMHPSILLEAVDNITQ